MVVVVMVSNPGLTSLFLKRAPNPVIFQDSKGVVGSPILQSHNPAQGLCVGESIKRFFFSFITVHPLGIKIKEL